MPYYREEELLENGHWSCNLAKAKMRRVKRRSACCYAPETDDGGESGTAYAGKSDTVGARRIANALSRAERERASRLFH